MVKDNLLEWVVKGHNPKVWFRMFKFKPIQYCSDLYYQHYMPQIESLLHEAKNHSLPENIITTLKKKSGNSTACVQLLICKMSPVIWGVQKTISSQTDLLKSSNGTSGRAFTSASSVLNTFLETLPPKEKFVDFGDHCEKRFPFCKLLKFDGKSS